ncbi:MAG: hypothetical protein ACTJHC_00215 [Vagococcus sp.]
MAVIKKYPNKMVLKLTCLKCISEFILKFVRLEELSKHLKQRNWSWYEEYNTTVKNSILMKTERMVKNHILPAFIIMILLKLRQ